MSDRLLGADLPYSTPGPVTIEVRCVLCPTPDRLTVPDGLTEQEAAGIAYQRHVHAVHVCVCGETDAAHALRPDGTRGACSVSVGPTATPCGCREFTPKGRQP